MATHFIDWANGDDGSGDGSEGNPYKTIQKGHDVATGGDIIAIEATANYEEMITISNVGVAGNAITYEGYSSGGTLGDGGQVTVDGGTGTRVSGFTSGVGEMRINFHNIIVIDTSGIGWAFETGDEMVFVNCIVDNAGGDGFHVDNEGLFDRCIARNCTGVGFEGDGGVGLCNSIAHDNGGSGMSFQNGFFYNCVAYGNSGNGQFEGKGGTPAFFLNCTADGKNISGTDCYNVDNSGLGVFVIMNCIAYQAGTSAFGINCGRDVEQHRLAHSVLVNSNQADYNNMATAPTNEIIGAPSFTAEVYADYRLESDSAAKAAGIDAGELVD